MRQERVKLPAHMRLHCPVPDIVIIAAMKTDRRSAWLSGVLSAVHSRNSTFAISR
jgi:hypothetical protein